MKAPAGACAGNFAGLAAFQVLLQELELMSRTAFVAVIAALSLTVGAQAADAINIDLAGTEVPLYEGDAFDWDGFYAGVYGVGQGGGAGTALGAGVELGMNAQFEFVLVGGEIALQGLTDGATETIYGRVTGRTGLLLTDDVLVYAALGYGVDFGAAGNEDLLVGGGVELALQDNVSVRAEYLRGLPIGGGTPVDQITLGTRFHF